MLGQITGTRSSAEAIIEKAFGPDYDWSKILGDQTISKTVQKLGLDAFSDDALQYIVSALNQQALENVNINDTLKSNEPLAA